VLQKNTILINDTLEGGMLTACKHANGRDWWILIKKYVSDKYFRILFTPSGIAGIDTISVGGPISMFGGQAAFSPDGNWFATYDNLSKVRIYNFDRCNGNLFNYLYYPISDPYIAGSVSFSPNSERLYISNSKYLYQLDLTAANIISSQTLIGETDTTFYSPWPPFLTNFWYQMLGPDGKIYINSQASVVDLHVINLPNNVGLACDFQAHSFYLGAFNKSTFPNHVNYYLGCDTSLGCPCLTTGNEEITGHNFEISITPNPSTGIFKVFYLLPQNKPGEIKIYDINGRSVRSMKLPVWSTIQTIDLSSQKNGIYTLVIESKRERATQKMILIAP
jgi:WD40 repeat protein